jgi:hypothetical protein
LVRLATRPSIVSETVKEAPIYAAQAEVSGSLITSLRFLDPMAPYIEEPKV